MPDVRNLRYISHASPGTHPAATEVTPVFLAIECGNPSSREEWYRACAKFVASPAMARYGRRTLATESARTSARDSIRSSVAWAVRGDGSLEMGCIRGKIPETLRVECMRNSKSSWPGRCDSRSPCFRRYSAISIKMRTCSKNCLKKRSPGKALAAL